MFCDLFHVARYWETARKDSKKRRQDSLFIQKMMSHSHIGVIEVVRLKEEIVGQFNQSALSIVWRILVRNKKIDITIGLELHFNDSLTSVAGSASLM